MSHSTAEILTGAAVLALAAGFAFYATNGAGLANSGGTYPLTASFQSAQGISAGTDVRLAGVKVGSITGLQLNPQTFYADAQIAVSSDIQLPVDSAIVISQDGLLGGSFVEILPGGMPDNLAAGDEIEDTQGSVSLLSLLMKFVGGEDDEAGSGG